MQATMKNIKMSTSKGGKAEVLCHEILRKINQIGEKTYKLKKDVNDIYGLILSKPGATMFVEGSKAELWKEASDDFSQRWKEIAAEKYEVECMKGKIVFSPKRRAMSMVK